MEYIKLENKDRPKEYCSCNEPELKLCNKQIKVIDDLIMETECGFRFNKFNKPYCPIQTFEICHK